MVENANIARKTFIANACLHTQPGTSRSFLRRNLQHILDSHEKALGPSPDDAATSHETMIANDRRAAGWDYPTKEMLEDLTKGDKPVLQLASLHIRHPRSKSKKRKREPRDDDDEGLDWLPDPQAPATWPCQVRVNVREKESSKRNLHTESRQATISQIQQMNSGHSSFDVTLENPFLIEVDELFVAVDSGTNGFRQWRRTVTANYHLEVTLQCGNSDDTADLLSELEGQQRTKYEQIAGIDSILRGVWDELPHCPGTGQILSLKRSRGHSVINLPFGIELSMGWTRKRESLLQRYNRSFVQGHDQNSQLPTPSASSEGAERTMRHVVTYKFCEGPTNRVKKVEGLRCPLCREQSKTFPRLLLHCSTFHDHFRFDVDDSQPDASPDPSVINKTVLLAVSTKRYEKVTEKKDERDAERENWVAPDRPFDLQAHLRGDDDWTGYAKAKVPKRRGKIAGTQQRDSQPVTAPRPALKRPAPDEVADLPVNGHRRHPVPNVPNLRFYHTLSKKPMNPGDMVSDSDESVDEFWMADIQRQTLKELGINGAAQDFTVAFNRHLAREQSTSSVLMREAMVRFTRLYRSQLQDVSWQRPFRKKLEQLQNAGVINRPTVTHCIQLLQRSKPGEDVEMTNGMPEAGTAKTSNNLNAQTDGVLGPSLNGVRHASEASGGASRTPSLEPSGRGTPAANGERRSKGRVRWGVGGSVNRDSVQPSPSADRTTPNVVSPAVNGKRNGEHLNGDSEMDIDPKSDRPQVNGFHKALGKEKSHASALAQPSSRPKQSGLCVCGKSAKDTRAAVICSGLKCVRKDFHLACVNLERRQHGWKCTDCASAA